MEDLENCWALGYDNQDDEEEEIVRTYLAVWTLKVGICQRNGVFDGVYPLKGQDTQAELKKEQIQCYELRKERQYAPMTQQQPIKTPVIALPMMTMPKKVLEPLGRPAMPEACEFKVLEPRKIYESVRVSHGNTKSEKENLTVRSGEFPERKKTKEKKHEPWKVRAYEKSSPPPNKEERARSVRCT